MKWKQQSGHLRLAQANSQHSSLNQTYLVREAQLLDHRRIYHTQSVHTQCHTVNRELVYRAESMKSIGKSSLHRKKKFLAPKNKIIDLEIEISTLLLGMAIIISLIGCRHTENAQKPLLRREKSLNQVLAVMSRGINYDKTHFFLVISFFHSS